MISVFLATALSVPFSPGPGGTFTVPVRVDGATAKPFVIDLGAGHNVLAPPGTKPERAVGYLTGFRMTGERLDGTLYAGPQLDVAGLRLPPQPVGYWDGASAVAGFLSAKQFEALPITLDFPNNALVFEDEASLSARQRQGYAVPLKLDDVRAKSLQLFADVDLGSGQHGECLIDTGQFNTQLNKRYMQPLNRSAGSAGVVQQDDRFIARLPKISLDGAPQIHRNDTKVIFRDLIYDCVIGNSFWGRNTSVTLDIAHRTMYVRQLPAR